MKFLSSTSNAANDLFRDHCFCVHAFASMPTDMHHTHALLLVCACLSGVSLCVLEVMKRTVMIRVRGKNVTHFMS